MAAARPELSVVIPTDSIASVRKVLVRLGDQSVANRLEVVLVVPSATVFAVADSEKAGLLDVRVIEVADIESLPRARARGVEAARAPVVVLGETHSFPEDGWAAALIAAHRGPWAAVGPSIGNANPDTRTSWANLLIDYGQWVDVTEAGPARELPGHNSAYKRDVLIAYGSDLARLLNPEHDLITELVERGHGLYLEPRARILHLNTSSLVRWPRERFTAGRTYAALRCRGWPRRRRIVYSVGAPLIPVVRAARILRRARERGSSRRFLLGVLPALGFGLVASAAGELVGYATGLADEQRLYRTELHKARDYVRPRERELA